MKLLIIFQQTLTVLDLENNRITEEGAKHFSNALQNNHVIKKVNLCQNLLKRGHVISMLLLKGSYQVYVTYHCHQIRIVSYTQMITSLDLSSRQLGHNDAEYIAHFLENNTVLSIHFPTNRFDSALLYSAYQIIRSSK